MKTHRLLLIATLVAAFASASCSSTAPGDGDPNGYGNENGQGWGGGGGYGDSVPLPGRDERYSYYGPGSGSVEKSQFTPVYFAFDSFGVRGAELQKIDAVASFLRGESANLLVAGFTDEIGTDEYNRVLGERRALAVRSALLERGIDPGRIQTVSFGEDMPAEIGNHALNRRVEFGVVQ